MRERLAQLSSFFEGRSDRIKIDALTGSRDTSVGTYVPANLESINFGLRELVINNVIEERGPFCDDGCGDGRVVALASSLYSLPSFGVEYDLQIAGVASDNLDDLRSMGLVRSRCAISAGDFNDDSSFASCGIAFGDIATHYNFVNNDEVLASKICDSSPKGTLLVLHDPIVVPKNYLGLRNIANVSLPSRNNNSAGGFLHVYRK